MRFEISGWIAATRGWILALAAAVLFTGQGLATNGPSALLYKTFTMDQGLFGIVTALAHDNHGFIWAGTENGLYRYESGRFRKQDLSGSPSTWIHMIKKARDGGIWLNANRHIVHFKHGTARQATSHSGKPLVNAYMDTDSEGFLWAIDNTTLWREQADGSFAVQGTYDRGSQAVRSHSLSIGAKSGKQRFILGGRIHTWWDGKPVPTALSWDDTLMALQEDGTGCLWAIGAKKILRWPHNASQPEDATHLLHASFANDGNLFLDLQGRLWIPTTDGFLAVKGESCERYSSHEGLPKTWGSQACTDLEDNIWLGGASLYRILGSGHIQSFKAQDPIANTLVWAFERDKNGILWAATSNGIYTLGIERWNQVPGTAGIPFSELCKTPDGNVLAGASAKNPILRLTRPTLVPSKLVLKIPTAMDKSLADLIRSTPQITAMLCDRKGMLWLTMTGCPLMRVDPSDGRILETVDESVYSRRTGAFRMIEDGAGRVWIASKKRIICKAGERWLFLDNHQTSHHIQGVSASDRKDEVLVYYEEPAGISRITIRDNQLSPSGHLSTRDGLLSDAIFAIDKGPDGKIWVATDKGVSRYDGKRFRHFTHDSGLPSNDCCQNSLYIEKNGDAWVGTAAGPARFVANQEKAATAAPKTWIMSVERNGKWVHPDLLKDIRLPHHESTLEFRFDSPACSEESRLQFQVKLTGFEKQWREVENRSCRYTSLPSGDYCFQARTGRMGEAWGESASFAFSVASPWYHQWWVILLACALVFYSISCFVRWKLRKMSRAKARLEALIVSHTRELHVTNHALQEANRELKNISLVDTLTEMENRQCLAKVMKEETSKVLRAYRNSLSTIPVQNQDLVLFLIDLDHFTRINERWGHSVGDIVIKRTAQILKSTSRETDLVVRMDGESFLLLARSSSREEAHVIAERIRSIISDQVVPQPNADINWTCSIGYVAFPFQPSNLDWMSWEKTLEIADACLEIAKTNGRNAWLGVNAKPGLDPVLHEHLIPWEMDRLVEEGVIEVASNLHNPFRSRKKALSSVS